MTRRVLSEPYILYAQEVRVCDGTLIIGLSAEITVSIAVISLGRPWTTATTSETENVRLDLGGSCLFWEDLDEVIALDEWLPYALGMQPAALLGKRNRGKKASPKKARAARANGAKGGRPRKTAA